jgi:zinc/manganese transport system substrate-binding protein
MQKRMFLWSALLLALLSVTAQAETSATPKPKIITSFSILADMTRQIGGEAIEVTSLVPADGDAHAYQPKSDDLKQLQAADLIIVNGLDFEPWLKKTLRAAAAKAPVVTASKGVKALNTAEAAEEETHAATHDHSHDHGSIDPHAWQDLGNGKIYVQNIAAALTKLMPQKADSIRARTDQYLAELTAEDAKIRAALATIPSEQRLIITSHDAFGYFGAAYGVRFVAPYGLSTETEPSAKDIARLTNQIKSNGVKTIFAENMTNPRLIEQLGRDAGARLGGTLYADSISPPSGPAPTYLDIFRNNLPLLVQAMTEIKKP